MTSFAKTLSLIVLTGLTASLLQAQSTIRLNQIGFYPEAPKVAVVLGATEDVFYVTTPGGADTVFTGTLGAPQTWAASNETVRQADFSAFQTPGEYVVAVPGQWASYPFRIAPAVHEALARASIKGFYFQRASTPLLAQHAGIWARSAGHPDTRVLVHPSAATAARPPNSTISAPKGWYDAGDYNKYIVNSGITTGTLLMLYEHFPDYVRALDLNIPESGDAVPDLLDEVLWNLRWMLDMQDPDDGGVYHKLTNPNFDGMVMPGQATSPRYVVQKSTAATLDFAAVTALAARVFADFEAELPGLADSCRTAAQAAWNWARRNPAVYYRQNEINQAHNPDVFTGEYGDGSVTDEFRWAAAELFLTTGQDSFVVRYHPLQEPASLSTPGWPNVGTLAFLSLAHHRQQAAAAVDTAQVKQRLVAAANGFLSAKTASPYDIVMGRTGGDFFWGSNSLAANQGILLLSAYTLTGNAAYLDAALANLDYILGRNATGYSFVTGYGDKTPLFIHHRQSEADRIPAPVPGLLAGGPNPNREDQGGCPSYPSTLPARAFLDHVCSYASNEIAINWNAPLAYLAVGLEALLSPTGTPVAVEDVPRAPEGRPGFALVAYPNPAHAATVARFELTAPAPVTLTLYDALGRPVVHLKQDAYLPAGSHTVPLNVRGLAGGVYLLRLEAGGATETRQVVVGN